MVFFVLFTCFVFFIGGGMQKQFSVHFHPSDESDFPQPQQLVASAALHSRLRQPQLKESGQLSI